MNSTPTQSRLASSQITEFYHDLFVDAQIDDYKSLVVDAKYPVERIVDIGGGCGYFAKRAMEAFGIYARVIDTDRASIQKCNELGVDGRIGDAVTPQSEITDDLACFNLMLHHMVSRTDRDTSALQAATLSAWKRPGKLVFVNEYIYDSYFSDLSARLIYEITSSRILSLIASVIARAFPSLRANTFGVGVRFRSLKSWHRLFNAAGFTIIGERRGAEEDVSFARRLLLIKSKRRDSFLLTAEL